MLSVVITLVLAFVFLHEPFTAKSMVGCALVAAGTLFMAVSYTHLTISCRASQMVAWTSRSISFSLCSCWMR